MSNDVYFITKCNERDGLFHISDRLAWFIGKYTDREGVTMTHNAKKCVQELLASDGVSVAGRSLKEAADLFSSMQEGCCPKNEVLQMFRRAYQDGSFIAYSDDKGVVAGYRALTDIERAEAEERRQHLLLRQERQKKSRTPKPSSSRRNPAVPKPLEPSAVPAQDVADDEYNVPLQERQLVGMS